MFSKTELKYIQEIQDKMSAYISSSYKKGATERDAHPKTLGLVKGYFSIEPNLPNELKQGIFGTQNKYPVLIRFSNGNHKIQSDLKKDIRGISLKLIAVSGQRTPDSLEKNTQDFLLMSHATMPFGTLKKFRDVIVSTINSSLFLKLKWLLTNLKTAKLVKKSKLSHQSLSTINYWSTTTYAFGNTMVKYKLTPSVHIHKKFTIDNSYNRLANRLKQELATQEIAYDFCVQFYKNEKETPTKDMSVEWDEKLSPFKKVASLTIPKQVVGKHVKLNQKITYSLTNSLLEHKAVGELNNVRIKVYKALAELRHHLNNNNPKYEPTLEDFKNL